MTEYFTNNSRPYAENLNDGILLSDAVDLTVKASIPSMYSDESFNSNLNVERLAGVSLVTMVANTGVTVGSTSLSGTGSVTFRVYPNFGLFEKWNRISWTGTGDVSCSLAKVDGTSISVNVVNGSALASNVELSKLQQLDVTFVLSGASVSDISFEFVASADNDLVVASISQANVTGLESSLDGLDSAIATGLSGLSDDVEAVSDRVTALENATTGDLQLNNTYFQTSRSYWYKDNNMVEINIEARARGSVANPTLWNSGVLPASVTPPRYIYGVAIVKENPSSTTFTTVPFEIGSSNGASILGNVSERNIIYINIVYSLWQED